MDHERSRQDWVVVLEFSVLPGARQFHIAALHEIVERLREWQPSGLYHPDRCAVQLHIYAAAAHEALSAAMSRYERAAKAVGMPGSFSRAEVLTLGAFEASWDETLSETPVTSASVPASTSVEVYQATRALLGASTPSAVTDILVGFVLRVGGRVTVGGRRDVPGMLYVKISASPDEQLYAVAESFSVAGLLIERWLPPMIEDARHALVVLGRL